MIKVCDAIMGMGKTSAAINYMNANPSKKFIFITPYLDEAKRIKYGCPSLGFAEPSDKLERFNFSKSKHTEFLISISCNIATTHQAFKHYSKAMLNDIKEKGYTLIIDEDMDVLEQSKYHKDDVDMLVVGGYLKFDGVKYIRTDKPYDANGVFKDLIKTLETRDLMFCRHNGKDKLFFWALPAELISSFQDVYVLTYLFDGQGLCNFFKLHNLDYEYISVSKVLGNYVFDEGAGYRPAYIPDIFEKVTVFDNEKLNKYGKHLTALSMNWYRNSDNCDTSKRNLYNFFRYYNDDVASNQKMWGSHIGEASKIKGKGFTNGYVVMNAKATNKYSDRTCLAYMSNIFMNLEEKIFYEAHGINIDEDMYALSTLVQWVWRSAIRNGEHIVIYIPSRRMRELFMGWMEKVSRGEVI